jgi:hypothetical protein
MSDIEEAPRTASLGRASSVLGQRFRSASEGVGSVKPISHRELLEPRVGLKGGTSSEVEDGLMTPSIDGLK